MKLKNKRFVVYAYDPKTMERKSTYSGINISETIEEITKQQLVGRSTYMVAYEYHEEIRDTGVFRDIGCFDMEGIINAYRRS